MASSQSSSSLEIVIDDRRNTAPPQLLDCGDVSVEEKTWNKDLCQENNHHQQCEYRPRMISLPTEVDLTKNVDGNPRPRDHHRRNQVIIDYKTLRKSGYFLGRQMVDNNRTTENVELNLDQGENQRASTELTQNWINLLPDSGQRNQNLDDSEWEERKYPKVDGLTREYLLNRYTTEEDHIKRFVLSDGDPDPAMMMSSSSSTPFKPKLCFSSHPGPVLSSMEIETILEETNEKLDAILESEKPYRTNSGINRELEYDYVCGTVAFPESWLKSKSSSSKQKPKTGFFGWIKRLLSTAFIHGGKGNKEGQVPSSIETSGQHIIVEPYKGPILLNGAIIQAGSERVLSGNVVDDVKAFLKAIHKAIYGDSPNKIVNAAAAVNSTSSKKKALDAPLTNEDAEIKRLTEMLQKVKLKNKTHSRSVFALRNVETIPVSSRRNRAGQQGILRNNRSYAVGGSGGRGRPGILSRVVNRMIRRRASRRNFVSNRQRQVETVQRYRIVANRVAPEGPIIQSTNVGGSVSRGIMSFVRNIAPFPVPIPTPGYPVRITNNGNNFMGVSIAPRQNFPRRQISDNDDGQRINLDRVECITGGMNKSKGGKTFKG